MATITNIFFPNMITWTNLQIWILIWSTLSLEVFPLSCGVTSFHTAMWHRCDIIPHTAGIYETIQTIEEMTSSISTLTVTIITTSSLCLLNQAVCQLRWLCSSEIWPISGVCMCVWCVQAPKSPCIPIGWAGIPRHWDRGTGLGSEMWYIFACAYVCLMCPASEVSLHISRMSWDTWAGIKDQKWFSSIKEPLRDIGTRRLSDRVWGIWSIVVEGYHSNNPKFSDPQSR